MMQIVLKLLKSGQKKVLNVGVKMIDTNELTPEQLRNRADRIKESAHRSNDLGTFNYEINKAKELYKLADILEKNNDTKS
jgi:hypothetical protein